MKHAAEIREYEQGIRWANRAILAARVKLALLWLPATLGLSCAVQSALAQRDAISLLRYSREEDTDCLWRAQRYGTALVGFCLSSDRANNYDGWLAPGDQYREDAR
ncbi:MAG: hypothetical protein ABR915_04155 [Thermoguttaceae bacterium]|jgi:hypothetical protein